MCRCEPATEDGNHYIEWVATYFGECVYSPVEKASFFIGLASIGFWLFAQAPQVWENFKKKSTDSLAVSFLLAWLLGDSANLAGAFLTHQLPTQIYTAIYFVAMDVVLWFQYILYTCIFPDAKNKVAAVAGKERQPLIVNDPTHALVRRPSKPYFALVVGALLMTKVGLLYRSTAPQSVGFSGRRLLDDSVCSQSDTPDWSDEDTIIGYAVGVVSAIFYLGSRLPQLWKNYRRKSTEGLSYLLFFFAVMGNTTYSLSIFLWAHDSAYLLGKLPWLAGSAGVLFFDGFALYQFLQYRNNIVVNDSHLKEVIPLAVASDEEQY